MRQIISLFIIFIFSYSFGQKEKWYDEYLFETYTIFEVTLLNELIKSKHEFDSIQVVETYDKFMIDSNWNLIQYPSVYSIRMNRKDQKIKSIKTDYFTAEFTYNLQGLIEKIKFNYTRKTRHSLYEGTTDYYEFKYENGRLIVCYDHGVYGANYPFKYEIKYY